MAHPDGRAVSSKRRPHFNPMEDPWHSFLLEAEWTTWLLSADRRNRWLENFQGPYRKSIPEHLFCGANFYKLHSKLT